MAGESKAARTDRLRGKGAFAADEANVESLKSKPPVPIEKAVMWTFEYLDAKWITPGDAPSSGAWSLLQWARTNDSTRCDFYRLFAVKFVPKPQERARQAEREQKNPMPKVYETIDRLLARSAKEKQKASETSSNGL